MTSQMEARTSAAARCAPGGSGQLRRHRRTGPTPLFGHGLAASSYLWRHVIGPLTVSASERPPARRRPGTRPA